LLQISPETARFNSRSPRLDGTGGWFLTLHYQTEFANGKAEESFPRRIKSEQSICSVLASRLRM
jgi:hypothetical protein